MSITEHEKYVVWETVGMRTALRNLRSSPLPHTPCSRRFGSETRKFFFYEMRLPPLLAPPPRSLSCGRRCLGFRSAMPIFRLGPCSLAHRSFGPLREHGTAVERHRVNGQPRSISYRPRGRSGKDPKSGCRWRLIGRTETNDALVVTARRIPSKCYTLSRTCSSAMDSVMSFMTLKISAWRFNFVFGKSLPMHCFRRKNCWISDKF